jgi:hypothetical protein
MQPLQFTNKTCPVTPEEGQRRLQIFNAAPELYSALKEVMNWLNYGEGLTPAQRGAKCETFGDMLVMADGAIRKAQGK